jgi:anti-sigma regulatory factor (Ser/Thr protein kinase)
LNRNSVAASRQFVLEALPGQSDQLREAAILMVSELATNAIVHAATGFEVTIDLSVDSLTIGVTDLGGGEPELRSPPASDAHGRGLLIVQELADEWGMFDSQEHPGKTVWCTLRLERESESARGETSTGQATDGRKAQPRRKMREVNPSKATDRSRAADKGKAPESPSSMASRRSSSRMQHDRCRHPTQPRSFALAAENSSSVNRP